MTTSESKGRFLLNESIRITNRIDSNLELECSSTVCDSTANQQDGPSLKIIIIVQLFYVCISCCLIFLVKRSLFADTFINCCLIRRELNITKMPRCLSIDYLKLVSKYSEVFCRVSLGLPYCLSRKADTFSHAHKQAKITSLGSIETMQNQMQIVEITQIN